MDDKISKKIIININNEIDIVIARSKGRILCKELGFNMSTIVAIATVLSELARNIFQYAGTGEIEIQVLDSNPLAIEIISRDQGPGITNLESILRKEFNSHASNIGQGLRTVKLLMDEFDVSNISSKGTEIRAKKYIS